MKPYNRFIYFDTPFEGRVCMETTGQWAFQVYKPDMHGYILTPLRPANISDLVLAAQQLLKNYFDYDTEAKDRDKKATPKVQRRAGRFNFETGIGGDPFLTLKAWQEQIDRLTRTKAPPQVEAPEF